MDSWLQDLRYGLRSLRQHPRITIAAVLCIALGVGVNTAVFNVVDGLLLTPMSVRAPERLGVVYVSWPGFEHASFSWANYLDVAERNEVFDDFAVGRLVTTSLATGEGTEQLNTLLVSGLYFDVLGVAAARGRTFGPEVDDSPGGHPDAVLGHEFWQRRFGGDAAVVGRTVRINGETFTVVGVMSPGFRGTYRLVNPDIYLPVTMASVLVPKADLDDRGNGWLLSVGRLREGVTFESAQQSLNRLAKGLEQEHPRFLEGWGLSLLQGGNHDLPPPLRSNLVSATTLLMALAAFVLLVACANVAGLLLARGEGRRREMGIRRALGAGSGRLLRQLLTESLLLAGLGGVAAVVLAWWSARFLPLLLPSALPVRIDPSLTLDLRLLGYAFTLSCLTGLIFGVAPALQGARGELLSALRGDPRRAPRGLGRLLGAGGLRSALAVFQIALSLLLLAGSGLFLRSLQAAQHIDPGFRVDGVLLANIDPSLVGYDADRGRQLLERLTERAGTLPGVRAVALGEEVPLGTGSQQRGVTIEGYEPAPEERMNPDFNVVGPGYFELLAIGLLEGRGFRKSDDDEAPPVVIINQTMAQRYWPEGRAVGRRLSYGGEWAEIVGMVEDIKYKTLGEDPLPYLYLPWTQIWEPSMELHLRTDGDPAALASVLREQIIELDPDLPAFSIRTLEEHTRFSLYLPRLGAGFVGVFGLLALLLAVVGLYGVMAYGVRRGVRDIGIRMALGASRRAVFARVLGRGLALALAGVVLGLLAAVAAGRLLSRFLYGLSGSDPLTLALATAVLLAAAGLATALPARRATRVDPATVLRAE